MLELPLAELMRSGNQLSTFFQALSATRGQGAHFALQGNSMKNLKRDAETFSNCCQQVGLITTHRMAEDFRALLTKAPEKNGVAVLDLPAMHDYYSTLTAMLRTYTTEAGAVIWLRIPVEKLALYKAKEPLFGMQVDVAFPSAKEDVEEAGKCRALSRNTACVFHLMRCAEVALKALAAAVGVAPQNDWGSYIREIDKELKGRLTLSGKRSSDEEFYANASAMFDNVKRAWRNTTMHIDKTYTDERAEEIFNATKSLMRHLSDRVKE